MQTRGGKSQFAARDISPASAAKPVAKGTDRAPLRPERRRQLRPGLAPALPVLGVDSRLPGRRQDQARRARDAHRWQYMPDRHRDALQAGAAKTPLLPHRGNRRARAPVESDARGLGAAQLRERCCQPSAGGVSGGAKLGPVPDGSSTCPATADPAANLDKAMQMHYLAQAETPLSFRRLP